MRTVLSNLLAAVVLSVLLRADRCACQDAPEDTCYTGGECFYYYFAEEEAATPAVCADICDTYMEDTERCLHFTHYATIQMCHLFFE